MLAASSAVSSFSISRAMSPMCSIAESSAIVLVLFVVRWSVVVSDLDVRSPRDEVGLLPARPMS